TAEDGLTEPLMFKMHVIVEEVEPAIDSQYTARFKFDMDSLVAYEGDLKETDILPEGAIAELEASETSDVNQSTEELNSENKQAQTDGKDSNVLYMWVG